MSSTKLTRIPAVYAVTASPEAPSLVGLRCFGESERDARTTLRNELLLSRLPAGVEMTLEREEVVFPH